MVHQPIFMGIAKQGEEIAVVFLQTEEKKQIIVATSEISGVAIKELAKRVNENISGYSWVNW